MDDALQGEMATWGASGGSAAVFWGSPDLSFGPVGPLNLYSNLGVFHLARPAGNVGRRRGQREDDKNGT